ncbi:uncharacterized protein LOC143260866 [Megalopta genalis]|uniref:uncharacterized protein LOC143260866 n=1 Tax=Megalopta genalis TaxID=115081 RepID=UPI003FD416C9
MPTLLASIQEFQERDSGWALSKILHLMVNSNKYQPLQVGCGIPVPRAVQLKRVIVNMNSKDDACFYWAVVSSLYPVKDHSYRASSYLHDSDVLRTEGFQMPVSFKDIPKFEEANDVSVNVFEWDRKRESCQTLQPTSRKREKHLSTHHHKYICNRCLQYFRSQEKLDIHVVDCGRMNECALILPTEDDKWLKFKNHAYKKPAPFVIYADLECLLEKQKDQGHGTCRRYQHHRAFSVGYYLHCRYDSSLCEYRTYRNEKDCIAWFASEFYKLSLKLQPAFDRAVPMATMTVAQISEFHTATHCHVCEEPLGDRDFFHNLSCYDAHFIIKELANAFEGKIDVLPLTKENYISFTKHAKNVGKSWKKHIKFRFVDSFKFLNSSLDKLSSSLDKSDLRILRNQFGQICDDDFHLLTRKGVFPYDYVASYDKLSDTRLPPREAFYSELYDSEISDVDYRHASEVWSRFNIQTLGQYSDLYLKVDVLLLANVFENFREMSLDNYSLDPAHYYTLPGFAWDAMLTDMDMLLFVERGLQGGLSQCSHRYARANNKYMSMYNWN